MTIRRDDLHLKFLLLSRELSLGEAIAQLPEQARDLYLVIPFPGERFVCLPALDLPAALDTLPKLSEKRSAARTSLEVLFGGLAYPAADLADPALNLEDRPWTGAPTQALAVLSDGQVAGVLPKMRVLRGGGQMRRGAEDQPGSGVSTQPIKYLDLQTYDGKAPFTPNQNPLQLNRYYTIKLTARDTSPVDSNVHDAILKYLWQSDEREIMLTILVQSSDFECPPEGLSLGVPRTGDSQTLEFKIRPLMAGRCELNILIYKGDTFIQMLTLTYTAGDLFSCYQSGRVMDAAFTVKPRALNLTILESRGGFELIMSKDGQKKIATLPITKGDLEAMVQQARQVIDEQVVLPAAEYEPPAGEPAFRLSAALREQGLRVLAEQGYHMVRELFFREKAGQAPEKRQELIELGNAFYELVRGGKALKIQVFSQHFMLPWGILYFAHPDEYDPQAIHPEWFLGFTHIIEHIPLWQTMQQHTTNTQIEAGDELTVSLNVNQTIDLEMSAPYVAEQIADWRLKAQAGKVRLVIRDTPGDLLQAMVDVSSTEDEVIYFYGHAQSTGLSAGGPDSSTLEFAPNARLTLGTLKKKAEITALLPGEPLVFINACESAELSPLFYDGFVPYFLAKGARGVIGTECKIPAAFAQEWARRFFGRFLAGEAVGSAVLALRNDFLEGENNVLGLLYALYVDADTRLQPPLA